MSWFSSAPKLDRTALLKEIFRTMDADGDGKVSIDEYKAVVKTQTRGIDPRSVSVRLSETRLCQGGSVHSRRHVRRPQSSVHTSLESRGWTHDTSHVREDERVPEAQN